MKINGGGLKYSVLFFVFTLFFLSMLYVNTRRIDSKELEVTFLDVGQGDASLIETPNGQNILIDAGEGNTVVKRLAEELSWWDKHIDLLILSHPHSDHLGGMIDVLRRYRVSKVLFSGAESSEADFLLWLELVKKENAELISLNHPQKIFLGEECSIEIIYPLDINNILEQNNLNNTSIVARLNYLETSFLFAGDAEEEVEKLLLINKSMVEADVLKAGHHGSDTSSSLDFLKAVDMDYVVISVGKDNKFKHPSIRILRKIERSPAKIYRTDLEGSIRMVSDGEKIYVLK